MTVRRPDDASLWNVSWEPDKKTPDFPGVTYTPDSPDLPEDVARTTDGDELLGWARARWREK